MIDISGAECPRDCLAYQVGDGAPLLGRQRTQAAVHVIVEVELRSDHAMYVHRPSGLRQD